MGVKNVAIPRKGKPPAARRQAGAARGFRRLVKWRTGAEGRIAALKARLRLGPHPHGRHRRCYYLVRLGHLCPQQHETCHPGPASGEPSASFLPEDRQASAQTTGRRPGQSRRRRSWPPDLPPPP